MEDKRKEELQDIMREEMSKAVKLSNTIILLVFDSVKIREDTIKDLEDVMKKHLKVYAKAFEELYEDGKIGRKGLMQLKKDLKKANDEYRCGILKQYEELGKLLKRGGE